MSDFSKEDRPAYSRESSVLRLPGVDSLDDLSAKWAWGGATGKGIRVAVIDSGIDADHPALEGCVDADAGVSFSLDKDGRFIEEFGPHEDLFGHGTACAGIIHEMAPEARITSVRVLNRFLSGKGSVFLRGMGWAVEQGFDVINLSLCANRKDWALPFYEICDQAYFGGQFVVTAANNVLRPSYPSLYASVTSVACNLNKDPFRFHYNPQPPTEFLATGVDVDVAWRNGGRTRTTGNSFAAPRISGVVALIRSKHPQLRPFQVKTVLWATAANVRGANHQAGRLTPRVHGKTSSLRASSALGKQ